MATPLSQFDYDLPPEFIAQRSVTPRDHSRLLVLDKKTGKIDHKRFFHIVDELQAGDVLVFNRSKVFKARLVDGGVEVFVLKIADNVVSCLLKPGRKFPIGAMVSVFGASFLVTDKSADGVFTLQTEMSAAEFLLFCDKYGSMPTPPYVQDASPDERDYQTVYAREVGSVAAPTAGFHFTDPLLDTLRHKGVVIAEVILHVGIGTFRPVQTETIEEHVMHAEWVSLSRETVDLLSLAKHEGRRVIAVGTTTTRVLEGVAAKHSGQLVPFEGELNIFITPGFVFQVIDGLITNFHLPKSTLLMLVSAFSSREHVLAAYEEAKRQGYRFFSFGDAMFLR